MQECKDFASKELKKEEEELFLVSRREMLSKSHKRRSLDDTTSPTNVVFPTNLVSSTPMITPPDTPTIITVPTTNPVTISHSNVAGVLVMIFPSTTNPANILVLVSNPTINPNFNLFLIVKSTFYFIPTSLISGLCHCFSTGQSCQVIVKLMVFTQI